MPQENQSRRKLSLQGLDGSDQDIIPTLAFSYLAYPNRLTERNERKLSFQIKCSHKHPFLQPCCSVAYCKGA